MTTPSHTPHKPLIPALSVGLVSGVTNVLFGISVAALIFTGRSAAFVAQGVGLILLGGIPCIVLASWFSSFRGNVVTTQDAPAAILAVMAYGALQGMAGASSRAQFVTLAALVMLTTVLTGITFLVLGHFRLGSLVRYLPYPVIGGFLAGTGFLLFTGGISVMVDVPVSLARLEVLLAPAALGRWLPGVGLACLMLIILNRSSHFLVLPSLVIGAGLVFYGVAAAAGMSVPALSQAGWLLGPFSGSSLWPAWSLADLGQIQWAALESQFGGMASLILISVVSLLLNASGIELAIRQDLDLNRELQVAGWGNLLGGLLGGSVGYHTLSDTLLNFRISKGNPVALWVLALITALPLFFGAALLSYIPKLILGALLVLLGLSFMYEWLYQAWYKFSRLDYGLIVLILVAIAGWGYLEGVGVGVVAAVGLFVVNYSQVNVTRNALTGAELQSRVTRTPAQRKHLMEHGESTLILQLQGYLFFGTANQLLDQVRQRLEQAPQPGLRYLILDFSKVNGMDSTALLSFSKIKLMLRDQGVRLLVTGPTAAIARQLENGEFIPPHATDSDLDHGLEWVENEILAGSRQSLDTALSLREVFGQMLPETSGRHLDALFAYLERQDIGPGEYVIQQSEPPDHIYFVASGQVTAQYEAPGEPPVRLETMRAGRVIGELGFYLGKSRTAAVVADEASVVYKLSAARMADMEAEAPEVASCFHKLTVQLLAERATHLIRAVVGLEK